MTHYIARSTLLFLSLTSILIMKANADEVGVVSKRSDYGSTWRELKFVLKYVINECRREAMYNNETELFTGMSVCLKRMVLRSLDKMVDSEVIHMPGGMDLIKYKDKSDSEESSGRNILEDIVNGDFVDLLFNRAAKFLDTHVIKFSMDEYEDETNDKFVGESERRRRHRYRQIFPIMVVGYMALAAFLVPLGFQFMAMLGGKALLLSKIALVMSTFQGIRKVAASGLNYGWYHVPHVVPHEPHHHHPHYHERGFPHESHHDLHAENFQQFPAHDRSERRTDLAETNESPTGQQIFALVNQGAAPNLGGILAFKYVPHQVTDTGQINTQRQLFEVNQSPSQAVTDTRGNLLTNEQQVLALLPYFHNSIHTYGAQRQT